MKGLVFEPPAPQHQSAPNRTDVVCFIGLVNVRGGELPADLMAWLQQQGWWATAQTAAVRDGGDTLTDVPVPIDSWERFDQLFAWNERPYGANVVGATYLGAAVRSFFAQGGRRCFVIRRRDALAYDADRSRRDAALRDLIPRATVARYRRADWHGLHHLWGLAEVSFVAFPDLAELAADVVAEVAPAVVAEAPPVGFVECSRGDVAERREKRVVQLRAPRCDVAAYGRWRTAVHRATLWLSDHRRDVQLLSTLPLPDARSEAASDPLAFMHRQGWLSQAIGPHSCPADSAALSDLEKSACSLASAFLQLSFPWLRTQYSGDLPGDVEPAEGVLAGLLARNALMRGSFRNASALATEGVIDQLPRLSRAQRFGLNTAAPQQASPRSPLIDRLSLFGTTPEGIRLLSDVTTSNEASYRQAAINRTIALVMRAARGIGEESVFETSGERLWTRVATRLEDVFGTLPQAGALAGKRPQNAYQVRCDRSTMSQQDIDAGRVIVHVLIRPAASIETLRIQLALSDSGGVSLAAIGMEAA